MGADGLVLGGQAQRITTFQKQTLAPSDNDIKHSEKREHPIGLPSGLQSQQTWVYCLRKVIPTELHSEDILWLLVGFLTLGIICL